MAVADGFHVDTTGNLWLGSDRETFDSTTRSEAKFYVQADGTMVAKAGASFAGDLSAAGGTFSGNLSAAGGTFTGTLSGVDGTFSGTISGTQISGGTISGTTISGDTISGGTINGTTINAGTITTGELNLSNLTVSGTISGSRINGGTISGSTLSGGFISGGSMNFGNKVVADTSGITLTGAVVINPTSGNIGNGNVIGSFSSVSSPSIGNSTSGINIASAGDLQFVRAGSTKFEIELFENQTHDDIRPVSDDVYDLGSTARRFDDIYATNTTIQTSDITLKENIETTDLGLDFINDLTPIEFTWKDGGVRTHLGFSAQDIKEKLITHKGSDQNMAVYTQGSYETYYLKGEEDEFGSFDWTEQEVGEHDFERFGLRISELIPVLTKAIQELSAKNDALESRIAVLEG